MKDTNILTQAGIDLNASMQLFGDMDTYNDMLEDFLKEFEGKMANAEKYKNDANMAEYSIIVHSLKSDCKYFGMLELADKFYRHEMAGKENNYYFVSTNFDNLKEEAYKMYRVLQKYMGVDETGAASPAPAPAANEQAAPASTKKTIIVADDSNIIRNFVVKVFGDDYDIKAAEDGNEAISIVANTPSNNIACMLLDLNMPKVDGFAVLEYFNTNNLFDVIPISIITGANDRDTIDKSFNYPIVDMLQKPFNEISVKNVVEKTMARKKENS